MDNLPASSDAPTSNINSINLPSPFSLTHKPYTQMPETNDTPKNISNRVSNFYNSMTPQSSQLDKRTEYSSLHDIENIHRHVSHVHNHIIPPFSLPQPDEQDEEQVQGGYEGGLEVALKAYWTQENLKINRLSPYSDDMFHYEMPLARIKKIMRFDEQVVMIGAAAPILLSKACELFLGDIATRAWHHTSQSRRRTVKFSDITAALPKTDVFDFLIDIIPRDDVYSSPAQPQTVAALPVSVEANVFDERIQSQKELASLIPQVMSILDNLKDIPSQDKTLRLPDVGAPISDHSKYAELQNLSKEKLTEFPQEWLPIMHLLLQSAFENNQSASNHKFKKMKF